MLTQELEIFISFLVIGFITWYGTGLDDLLFMSVVFKKKSYDQKVAMFFGNLTAVFLIVLSAAYLSHFRENIEGHNFLTRLPGLIPIAIGFLEIRSLSKKKRRKKIKRKIKSRKSSHLFAFAFFLYAFNSIDDFVVTSSIFFTNSELLKIFAYGTGFMCGAAISLFLASKFSRITQKITFLEFLAPVVLIIVGTLILSGFFAGH
jgi:cadmium resistance protein CadD (predicted permease)